MLAAVQLYHGRFSGANREKVLVENANDSIWALDGDSIRLVCRHSRTSISQWFRRSANGVETLTMIATTINVGSDLTLTMSQALNGSSYRCRLVDVGLSPVFASGQNTLLLGGTALLILISLIAATA